MKKQSIKYLVNYHWPIKYKRVNQFICKNYEYMISKNVLYHSGTKQSLLFSLHLKLEKYMFALKI